jgi:hypothetical protein
LEQSLIKSNLATSANADDGSDVLFIIGASCH